MSDDVRVGCCADRRKPCAYHEGWEDGFEIGQETGCEHDLTRERFLADVLDRVWSLCGDERGSDEILSDIIAAVGDAYAMKANS